MKMTRRSLAGLATIGVAALALGACAGGGGGGEPTTDDDGRIVVTFWHSMRGNNGEQLQQYIDEFNESQSEIFVDASEHGMYDEAYTKLMQVAGTSDAPDLMQLNSPRMPETVEAGIVTPMQQFIDADDSFDIESLLPLVRNPYTLDGELQYMPQAASMEVVFYNVDAFREAGLDPDQPLVTFDDFENAARTLKEELGMDQGGAFLINAAGFNSIMTRSGEHLVNNENGHTGRPTEAVFNSDRGVEVMTWLQEMFDEGLIGNYGRAHDDMRQPWYTGQIGMIVDTTAATIMHEQAADFEFNSMPTPVPNGVEPGSSPTGGAGLFVLADSPDETQQAAYEFVKYLVSPEIQARWAANTGYFPVNDGAYEQQVLIDAMDRLPALASANAQAMNSEGTSSTLSVLSGVSISSTIADTWEAVYDGADPKTALDDAAAQVTSLLETYNEANG